MGTTQNLTKDLALLRSMASINSGTLNAHGVNAVGEIMADHLIPLGFRLRRYKDDKVGDLFYFSTPTKKSIPKLLISGHLDTVFELESGFLDVRGDQNYLYGPGVNDMKGGLVIALRALRQARRQEKLYNLGVLLSPDEELGSPAHASRMRSLAKGYDFGLVLEGVGKKWELCNERRGIAILTLKTLGQAGHSGHWVQKRVNAIDVMAQLITDIVSLADTAKGTTINTGLIKGGSKINIVAYQAEAQFDIRYSSATDFKRVCKKIQLLSQACGAKYKIDALFPPMATTEQTKSFMKIIEKAGKKIGRNVTFESRGSASDGNWLSACGLGVIDGLGAKGYDHHTTKERMDKRSIVKQANLITAIIQELRSISWEK